LIAAFTRNPAVTQTANVNAENWKAEANQRIEQHRKTEVTLTVTQNSKPIKNAEIKLTMLNHEFKFGSDILLWGRTRSEEDNAKHNRLFADVFNAASIVTYWVGVEKEKGKPDFEYTRKVTDWCKQNNIFMLGTPLFYCHHDPIWAKAVSPDELWQRQLQFSETLPKHFKNQIDAWVVANEFAQNNYNADVYKRWAPITNRNINRLGEIQSIKANFEAARKGNPNAVLLINDDKHGQGYEDLLNRLKDENSKPVFDAIGIQSHMRNRIWDDKTIMNVCEQFAKFGVPIYFTETSIMIGEEGERQADEAERFYTMLFSHPAVDGIFWWDFADPKGLWYEGGGSRNYNPRVEGLPPFHDPKQIIMASWEDEPSGLIRGDMTPKPIYERLKKLIKRDWTTNTTLQTDANGNAKIRVFRGTYSVEITLPDGTKTVREFHTQKEKNHWQTECSTSVLSIKK
jgi:GH35 family endo-1,4-beta-xylanase